MNQRAVAVAAAAVAIGSGYWFLRVASLRGNAAYARTFLLKLLGVPQLDESSDPKPYDQSKGDKKAYDKSAYAKGDKKAYDKSAYAKGDKKAYDKSAYAKGDKKAYDKSAYAKGDKKDMPANKKDDKKSKGKTVSSGPPCTDDCASGRAPAGSVERAKAHRGRPLRILCLHGGSMNAEGFRQMIQNLTDDFGPLVDFYFAQAPNADPNRPSGSFLWFGDVDKQGPASTSWWAAVTLPYLEGVLGAHGPFDGLLGYSMGASAAFHLLAHTPPSTFRFAVLCCGYVSSNCPAAMGALEAARPLRVPSLHVQGRNDFLMTTTGLADGMIPYFESAEVCRHPEGHTHPYDPRHVNQMAAFLLRFA